MKKNLDEFYKIRFMVGLAGSILSYFLHPKLVTKVLNYQKRSGDPITYLVWCQGLISMSL